MWEGLGVVSPPYQEESAEVAQTSVLDTPERVLRGPGVGPGHTIGQCVSANPGMELLPLKELEVVSEERECLGF